jgi:hypothetical protein
LFVHKKGVPDVVEEAMTEEPVTTPAVDDTPRSSTGRFDRNESKT